MTQNLPGGPCPRCGGIKMWWGYDQRARCEKCVSVESTSSYPVKRFLWEDGWHEIACDPEMEYSDFCRRSMALDDLVYTKAPIVFRCTWCKIPGCSEMCIEIMAKSLKMDFGKHRDKTLGWVCDNDMRYLEWMCQNPEYMSKDRENEIIAVVNFHRKKMRR